jgi:hypothetical protein
VVQSRHLLGRLEVPLSREGLFGRVLNPERSEYEMGRILS